jgi:hypothetical protein
MDVKSNAINKDFVARRNKKAPSPLDINYSNLKDAINGKLSEDITVGGYTGIRKHYKTGEMIQFRDKEYEEWFNPNSNTKYINIAPGYTINDGVYTDRFADNKMFETCPVCKKTIRKQFDYKMFTKTGMCLDCKVHEENQIKESGGFEKYVQNKILNNKLSYMKDTKGQVETLISGLNKKMTYVNEDGSIDTWDNGSYDSQKAFLELQLADIEKLIIGLEKTLSGEITEDELMLIYDEVKANGAPETASTEEVKE